MDLEELHNRRTNPENYSRYCNNALIAQRDIKYISANDRRFHYSTSHNVPWPSETNPGAWKMMSQMHHEYNHRAYDENKNYKPPIFSEGAKIGIHPLQIPRAIKHENKTAYWNPEIRTHQNYPNVGHGVFTNASRPLELDMVSCFNPERFPEPRNTKSDWLRPNLQPQNYMQATAKIKDLFPINGIQQGLLWQDNLQLKAAGPPKYQEYSLSGHAIFKLNNLIFDVNDCSREEQTNEATEACRIFNTSIWKSDKPIEYPWKSRIVSMHDTMQGTNIGGGICTLASRACEVIHHNEITEGCGSFPKMDSATIDRNTEAILRRVPDLPNLLATAAEIQLNNAINAQKLPGANVHDSFPEKLIAFAHAKRQKRAYEQFRIISAGMDEDEDYFHYNKPDIYGIENITDLTDMDDEPPTKIQRI